MFIKIMQQVPNPAGPKYSNVEYLYECNSYKVDRPSPEDTSFFIRLFPEIGISIEVSLDSDKHTAVYVMNNQGKTIETIFSNYPASAYA
jgi:hypothetical protein